MYMIRKLGMVEYFEECRDEFGRVSEDIQSRRDRKFRSTLGGGAYRTSKSLQVAISILQCTTPITVALTGARGVWYWC